MEMQLTTSQLISKLPSGKKKDASEDRERIQGLRVGMILVQSPSLIPRTHTGRFTIFCNPASGDPTSGFHGTRPLVHTLRSSLSRTYTHKKKNK